MKRILSLAILVVILVLLNGLAFADFDSNSANITHQYFPVKKWDWFKYVGYGNMTGETETFKFLGTEFVNSVNCLKFEIKEEGDVATAWIAQDTDGNVWFLKIIISEGVFTLGSGISNPFFYAEPKVGDILSQIFPESAGTYSEVTEIGIDVNLSTSLGPYENCIEITSYFDYEVEDLSYFCSGIGLVKIIYPQEGPPETGRELSEFGNDEQDLLYTPVTPCRIADTRKSGGAISAGDIRSYNVRGAVASQGGNSSCVSPKGEPRAVHVNVTSVPLGNGWLAAYPFGSTAPTASLVNYRSDAQNVANSGTIKTCFNCGKDITIKSGGGKTHVIIDVLGYYYSAP